MLALGNRACQHGVRIEDGWRLVAIHGENGGGSARSRQRVGEGLGSEPGDDEARPGAEYVLWYV
jgi:hypothetical protein